MIFHKHLVIFSAILYSLMFTIEQVSSRSNKSSKYPLGFQREKRLFSLFNIVQFRNDPCQALSSSITGGTCLSAQECSSQGGTTDGNCAAGFGVCCIFAIIGCSGIVTKNCTYVRNMGFPGADMSTGRTCSININRSHGDICQIRLDFGSITMIPLGTLPGECGGTGDALTVRSPHSGSQSAFPPPVCGTLTGQHMYFESGREGALAGQINVAQGSVLGDRRYNIKVSYISCTSRQRAPSGCTQYFTGRTGTITSYNFQGGQILADQVYGNCIRQERGFCSVQFKETDIATPDPFDLDAGNPDQVQDNCMSKNHVTIPSRVIDVVTAAITANQDVVTLVPSMRCNTVFGSAPGTSVPATLDSERNLPFVVNVRTLPNDVGRDNMFTGFSLDYKQLPC